MLRQKVGVGERERYERVDPSHSWNSNNIATNVLLYHLQRHSDHHANPTRRYQSLRDFEESPVLPTGYAGMIVLADRPAVWRRVMDPRVVAHFGGDVSRPTSARASGTGLARTPPPRVPCAAARRRRRPPSALDPATEVLAARCPGCGYIYEVAPATSTRASRPGPPGPTSPRTGAAPTAGCARRSTSSPARPSARWCEPQPTTSRRSSARRRVSPARSSRSSSGSTSRREVPRSDGPRWW